VVSSDAFGAMFGEITQLALSQNRGSEFIGLILKNETEDPVENLWLWFEYLEGCYSKLLIAVVDLTEDSNGVAFMEHIPTRYSRPIYATFYEANGVENAVSLGSVEAGAMLGIWIERQFTEGLASEVIKEENLYETDPDNSDLVRAIIPEKSDSIVLNMVWGEEYYGGPLGGGLI
jgi:hypothetical protein